MKPERLRNKRNIRRERWWQYAERAPKLFATIKGMERMLVCTRVSKHLNFEFIRPGTVFTLDLFVFAFDRWQHFAFLQSTTHETWVRATSSTQETRMRYTATDCFETFPFPDYLTNLDAIGERYYSHRQQIMQARQEGLTKTYNRFHDPAETSADIADLRALHVEMDQAVAAAYCWTDLDLDHGFHDTKQGLRYTLSEPALLLRLNHERYAQELAEGLHDKPGKNDAAKKKTAARGKRKSAANSTANLSLL